MSSCIVTTSKYEQNYPITFIYLHIGTQWYCVIPGTFSVPCIYHKITSVVCHVWPIMSFTELLGWLKGTSYQRQKFINLRNWKILAENKVQKMAAFMVGKSLKDRRQTKAIEELFDRADKVSISSTFYKKLFLYYSAFLNLFSNSLISHLNGLVIFRQKNNVKY